MKKLLFIAILLSGCKENKSDCNSPVPVNCKIVQDTGGKYAVIVISVYDEGYFLTTNGHGYISASPSTWVKPDMFNDSCEAKTLIRQMDEQDAPKFILKK